MMQFKSRAHCTFEWRAERDATASAKEGHAAYKNTPWVLILIPGSTGNTVEQEVTESRLKDWDRSEETRYRIEMYERWKKGEEAPISGTSVKMWGAITPAEIKQLWDVHVKTVEDLAGLDDSGLRNVGMGSRRLQQMARDWLATADQGKAAAQIEIMRLEMEKRDEQIKEQSEQIAELMEMMKADKPKRGRPAAIQ